MKHHIEMISRAISESSENLGPISNQNENLHSKIFERIQNFRKQITDIKLTRN